MPRVCKQEEFKSADTAALACALLGKLLVTRIEGKRVARRILETEAYQGMEDEACHASKGRTARTSVMFGEAGYWYVYLCYGIHEMLNLVTGERDYPAAILIRGVEGAIGPGRVTRVLRVDRRFNGLEASRRTNLWIEDDGMSVPRSEIIAGPRVGIDYAGKAWRDKPWRFQWKQYRGKLF